MASINTRKKPHLPPQGGLSPQQFEPSNTMRTHEGGPAASIPPELALHRAVCACLLYEDQFYENGEDIATRIKSLVARVPVQTACDLAIDARSHFNLRHVPLLVMASVAAPGRGGSSLIGEALAEVIQRPDELSEFVAIYARTWGVQPKAVRKHLSAQVKKGLAMAFKKFDRYQLAKYFSQSGERGAIVRGRDVMFMVHPRPLDAQQESLFKRIASKEAVTEGGAETWEAALSAGPQEGASKDEHKRDTFERMLRDRKLGYLALLRNLRGMLDAGVDGELVRQAILDRRGARRVLPFRYVAAARACPQMADVIDQALLESIADIPALPGRTVVLVDVSGSMEDPLSSRSALTRMDAAAALASVIRGDVRVFTFSDKTVEVTPRPVGIGGIASIVASQPHSGTYLGGAIAALNGYFDIGPDGSIRPMPTFQWIVPAMPPPNSGPVEMDRLICVTDEQSHDYVKQPKAAFAYMINVASAKNGVGYGGRWIHIDGFSEQIIRFIHEFEAIPEVVG